MITFLKITKKLYWMGVIGLIGTFFHIPGLKLFYLFFLLVIVNFILSCILVLKTDSENDDENIRNLKFLFQNLGMLLGIPCIYVRNRFRLPNIRNYKPQVLYSLPFEGVWTVANGGIDKKTSHSWSICPQRYAYDFFIEENGQSFRRNGKAVTDYLCYGKPILAPADGVVVELKNQFEDTPVSDNHEVLCSASDVRGNYVVIQHSAQEYSTIAHIKKDSFCIRPGDKVSCGQVIARCGNSGNTSEPHIHFQIQQGKSFLFSAGLPIWFTNLKNHTSPDDTVHISRGQLVEKELLNSI